MNGLNPKRWVVLGVPSGRCAASDDVGNLPDDPIDYQSEVSWPSEGFCATHGASVGSGGLTLRGMTISPGTLIGAGGVASRDVAARMVVAEVFARTRRALD